MSNFGFLKDNKDYALFAASCMEAEKVFHTSAQMSAIGARKGLEMAIKWVYDAEGLTMPYNDNLSTLYYDAAFHNTVDANIWQPLKYIIKLGNHAVHANVVISKAEALTSLHNLFDFIEWIDYCYNADYQERKFSDAAIPKLHLKLDLEKIKKQQELLHQNSEEIEKLKQELEAKAKELQAIKEHNQKAKPQPLPSEDISEFKTRKKYIDLDLKLLGWRFDNVQIAEEYEVANMAGKTGNNGFVDYVLFGENGKPLAVIEAKRTSKDPKIGKNQAKYYADSLEAKFGQRPMIFLSNGYNIYFWDDLNGPERKVGGYFSRNDLQRLMNRRNNTKSLELIPINMAISGRDYQQEGIKRVCEGTEQKHRRHLLVMATGTGKTRTAASLVDVLSRANYVTNVLFLADRIALVEQAKEAFHEYLPDQSLCNLTTDKDEYNARIVFSTYPTILNKIDSAKNKDGTPLFTAAHFDLIIIDEAHRSIFNKYAAIFEYFDAIMVGLTATPKSEVDKNTYRFFECDDGVPTFAYDYQTAIEEGYLVPYYNIEVETKIKSDGLHYDELPEEERQRYEEDFTDPDGNLETDIDKNRIDTNVFNQDTVDYVIQDVMQHGLKLSGGNKLAKTIIFAQNKAHAEFIVKRFNALYPEYHGSFCRRVVCGDTYVMPLINDFKQPHPPMEWSFEAEKNPQIAVSVDMLDTGIDVPHIGNLVFFKRVMSRTKFWQMIGRGTRKCPAMECMDGQNGEYVGKQYFYIFDYCGNFAFFRENPNGIEGSDVISLDESLFIKKIRIIQALQDTKYTDDSYQNIRSGLVNECHGTVMALNDEMIRVKLKREYVECYRNKAEYQDITDIKKKELADHIAPLISFDDNDDLAKNYDNSMYGLMLSILQPAGNTFTAYRNKLIRYSKALQGKMTIPQVKLHKELIDVTAQQKFWDERNIIELEKARIIIRELIKFLDKKQKRIIYTDIKDTVISVTKGDPLPVTEEFENYKLKVEHYIKDKLDDPIIYKLTHNKPITEKEYKELEHILTVKLGSKEDYEKEFKNTALGIMVRKIAGMDRESVNEAFAEFINDQSLNANQINFVNKIINHVMINGYIDPENLFKFPFNKPVNFLLLFDKNRKDRIMAAIRNISVNAGTEINGSMG